MRFLKFIFSRFFICITVIAALIAAIIFLCVYIHSVLPAAAAIGLAYALSVIAAMCLLLGKSPFEFKCGWLTIIVALPVAGAVLYFISYLSRCQKSGCPQVMARTGCSGFEYFADGAEYLNRLISLISTARRQVYLEYYIISKGHIWNAVNRELIKALERGVDVKIIYDGLGSALRAPKKDFKQLKKAGARIKIFNKLMPVPVSRLNFRDHRKIAAIDGRAVFLGGVNIGDEYANLSSPHGYWKDGGALFYGQIAKVYTGIFLAAFNDTDIAEYAPGEDKLTLYPVTDEPEHSGSMCEDYLAGLINSAKRRIYIFTPYLCMGDKLGDALVFAARRGVDVKIIIPKIPDKKLTYAITRTYSKKLVSRGVRVYTYTPGFMHFKGVICDDSALLGSYNFDYRSMRLNYECGVTGSGELADEMARDFEMCLALSDEFICKRRCAADRFFGALLCLFAPLV